MQNLGYVPHGGKKGRKPVGGRKTCRNARAARPMAGRPPHGPYNRQVANDRAVKHARTNRTAVSGGKAGECREPIGHEGTGTAVEVGMGINALIGRRARDEAQKAWRLRETTSLYSSRSA